MTIFAIIAPAGREELTEAVSSQFPGRNLEFSPGQFVVAADGLTAAQVAQKLGANGENGLFVTFSVGSHWGYHKKDLWEWLSLNAASS